MKAHSGSIYNTTHEFEYNGNSYIAVLGYSLPTDDEGNPVEPENISDVGWDFEEIMSDDGEDVEGDFYYELEDACRHDMFEQGMLDRYYADEEHESELHEEEEDDDDYYENDED